MCLHFKACLGKPSCASLAKACKEKSFKACKETSSHPKPSCASLHQVVLASTSGGLLPRLSTGPWPAQPGPHPSLLLARPLTYISQARPRRAGPCRRRAKSGPDRRFGLTLEHPCFWQDSMPTFVFKASHIAPLKACGMLAPGEHGVVTASVVPVSPGSDGRMSLCKP